jgi:hypothetical protein
LRLRRSHWQRSASSIVPISSAKNCLRSSAISRVRVFNGVGGPAFLTRHYASFRKRSPDLIRASPAGFSAPHLCDESW